MAAVACAILSILHAYLELQLNRDEELGESHGIRIDSEVAQKEREG